MIINIAELPDSGKRYAGEEPAAVLALDDEREVRAAGPVSYDLFAQFVSESLIVRGSVWSEVSFSCSRCGVFFPMTVKDGAFLRALDAHDRGTSVDLTPEIRESIILGFPTYPLCSATCKGLCSQCGTNLNAGTCDCRAPAGREEWAALDGLEIDRGSHNGSTKAKEVEE